MEHYGGYTTPMEAAIINKLATAWAKNHSAFSWDQCKKNVIDRLTVEHAKIIAGTFVQRIRPKDTDNSINTGFSMYDGSSGFKFCTNKEKHKKPKAAMGPQSKSLKGDLDVVRQHQEQEWTPPTNTIELTADIAACDDWTAIVASWDV